MHFNIFQALQYSLYNSFDTANAIFQVRTKVLQYHRKVCINNISNRQHL